MHDKYNMRLIFWDVGLLYIFGAVHLIIYLGLQQLQYAYTRILLLAKDTYIRFMLLHRSNNKYITMYLIIYTKNISQTSPCLE